MTKWIETWINDWDNRMFRALVNHQTSLWAFEAWCKNRGTNAANLADFNTNLVRNTYSFLRCALSSLFGWILLWRCAPESEPTTAQSFVLVLAVSIGIIFGIAAISDLGGALSSRDSTGTFFRGFWEDNGNLNKLLELSHINGRATFLDHAGKFVVICAGRVLEMEHQHGVDSDQAKEARFKLNGHHKLLVRFDLINPDQTEYFVEAKMQRTRGPGIDLNYLSQGQNEADEDAEPPRADTLNS